MATAIRINSTTVIDACTSCDKKQWEHISELDVRCRNCGHVQADNRIKVVDTEWLCNTCDEITEAAHNDTGDFTGWYCPTCEGSEVRTFLAQQWNEENGFTNAAPNDFGNADRVIHRYGYRLMFLHDVGRDGSWIWWDGASWIGVGTSYIESKVKFVLEGLVPDTGTSTEIRYSEDTDDYGNVTRDKYEIVTGTFNPGRQECLRDEPGAKHWSGAERMLKNAEDEAQVLRSMKESGRFFGTPHNRHTEQDFAELAAGHDWGQGQQYTGSMKNAMGALKADSRIMGSESIYATKSQYFAVKNGVIDTKTGGFVRALPSQMITAQAGTEYDPMATCPEWERFVSMNFPDEDTRRYLQKLVGYSLTGEATQKSFWFFYSKCPDTGKSLFLRVWGALFGDYGTSLSEGALKPGNGDGGRNPDLHAVMGKRLAAASEWRVNQPVDETLMKRLTSGGSDDISTRGNYSTGNTVWTPQATIVIATNNLSRIDGGDEAVWSRVVVVPFTVAFPKGDPRRDENLADRITRNELPGVLNWALDGLEMYREEGLAPSREMIEATNEYQIDSDGVTQIMTQLVEEGVLEVRMDPDDAWASETFEKVSDLFRLFRDTAEKSRITFDMTQKAFKQKLSDDGFKERQLTKTAYKGQRRIVGLKIHHSGVSLY